MESLDRACVTFFSTDFTDLAEKPMPSAAILAEAAMDRLDDLSVGGGTELLPALHHVLQMLERHRSPERQSTLVLITDGQVGNEQAIHEELKPWCGKLRVHTFGIDTAVNDSFLRQLAEEHGGSSTLATPEDNIPNLVAGIARRFGTEVVRELQIGSPWEGSGAPVGALWEGDALTLCMRTAEEIAEVVIAGKSGADGAEVSFRIPVAPISGAGPRLLWQRQRIHALERECRDDEAAALACAANLLSSGTAFVAWDEEERIALTSPRYSVYQPSLTDRTHLAGFAPLAACSPMVLYGSGGRSLPRSSMCLQAPALPLGSASRLEEPPPEAHRPSEMDRLPKLLGIEDGAAVRLVDWLEQWIWLSPSQSKERKKSLRKLIGKLAWISNTEKRIDQFSAWLIASVEEPVLTAIQRVLKEVNLVP
jgi:hypothetical protein